ncbi:unnamed protein product [Peniophora sp. CBMAI 1063]|nr:unnamed protein product [Peniophora sp. CBMAI 1063]
MSQPEFLLANNTAYAVKGIVPTVNFQESLFIPKGEVLKDNKPRYIVVTCMDNRIDPIRALGLEDAAIIRSAGGIAIDADVLRSLIVFQELKQGKEIAVVHHTDCGALRISTEEIHAGPKNIPKDLQFHEFRDVEEGVRRDVRWLKERVQEGVLLEGTTVMGYVIENETGKSYASLSEHHIA